SVYMPLVGERVAWWLRKEWPTQTVQRAAEAFNASEGTVKGWLRGKVPANAGMMLMIARWGRAFVAHVYEPVNPEMAEMQLEARLDAFARMQAEMTDELRRWK